MKTALILLLTLASMLFAAVPPNLPFASPEVHPDRTVTFRVMAPKATDVSIFGGWMAPSESKPLTKGADGIWSVTVGPIAPTVHAYWFVVDGGVSLDEGNLYVRLRTGGSSVSMVDVGGRDSDWAMRDVPHGVVEMNWVKSATFGGETRQIWVYLPPGYEKGSARFPVLYLFHGAGELYRAWTESGKANLIFDNLLAARKMKPMIVVMPYTGPAGNTPAPAGPPAAGRGPMISAQTVDYVLKEIMPWSEARFRIAAGRKNRAAAGFSAGGALTASVVLEHLDIFGQMGMFSAPIQDVNARFPGIAKDPQAASAKLDLMWIGVGKQDPLATDAQRKFEEQLNSLGIKHIYKETEGAHDYAVWRWCLIKFAPLLFRS